MKKIVTILGARPQFIKASVLSKLISERRRIHEVIIHTGQHYDENMSQVFFQELKIPIPNYNLRIKSSSHGDMIGKMLIEIEKILMIEKPDAVMVYGDTNSTLSGALAARKSGIKLIHVESGLRSFNMDMPEEVNRVLTDNLSDLLLCPTKVSMDNLWNEGFQKKKVNVVNSGDIMKNCVEFYRDKVQDGFSILKKYKIKRGEFVLATIHRPANTENIDILKKIFEGLTVISKKKKVLMPLHPRTKNILKEAKWTYPISIVDPVGYLEMLFLLENCNLVITDSGGLQKEAFLNGKPSLVLRNETEWVELIENGFSILVGRDIQKMKDGYEKQMEKHHDFSLPLYGNDPGIVICREIEKLIL